MAEALKRALDLVDEDARASVEVGAPPGHALAAVAARERARLIVVGAGGLGRMRLRANDPSVSAQVLSQATCPVLVLPEGASVVDDRQEYEADKAA